MTTNLSQVVGEMVDQEHGWVTLVLGLPSVLWHHWLSDRKGIWPIKTYANHSQKVNFQNGTSAEQKPRLQLANKGTPGKLQLKWCMCWPCVLKTLMNADSLCWGRHSGLVTCNNETTVANKSIGWAKKNNSLHSLALKQLTYCKTLTVSVPYSVKFASQTKVRN